MSQPLRKEQELYMPLPEGKMSWKRTEPRRSFKLSKSGLPGLIAVLLLVYLVVSVGSQFSRLSIMQQDVQRIQQEVEQMKQKNDNLRSDLQLVQSDAYIEKTAREKLGLVKPGETRVVAVPEGTQLRGVTPPAKEAFVAD